MSSRDPSLPLTAEEALPIFYRLLGELHHSYTALEHELACVVFLVVIKSGGKNDDVLIALLGSQRMASLKDTIKRLLKATKATSERTGFADKIFLQLGEISFFRDRLSHYLTVMADYNPEAWINMNFTGVRDRDKMEDIHFNLFALKAASSDLQDMRILAGEIFSHYIGEPDSPLPELPTWQYKPSMLVRNRPKSSGNQPPQKSPPRS